MSTQRIEFLYHCYGCGYIDNVKSEACPICGAGGRVEEVYEY